MSGSVRARWLWRVVGALGAAAAVASVAGCVVWLWSYRWLGSARRAVPSGLARRACSDLAAFLKLHPNHPEGHYLMGLALGDLAMWQPALGHFRRVPDGAREAADARWREADVLLQLNRAADAERALRRALELNPESLEARRGLIHLYRWQERQAELQTLFWEAYERTPARERAPLLAEWFRIRFGQYPPETSYRRLRGFLAAQPDDVDTAIALGRWSLRERQLGWAQTLLEQAFRQRPDKTDARAGLAACLLELGRADDVEQLLAGWPADQRDPRYWRTRGMWQQDLAGDSTAAAESYRRVLEAEPDDWQVRFRLVSCLQQLGDGDAAERQRGEAERVRELTRFDRVKALLDETLARLDRADNRHTIGEHYRALGYPREAAAWYASALDVEPNHQPSRMALDELRALGGEGRGDG